MTNPTDNSKALKDFREALIQVLLAGLFFLLAWNYGITEVIQNLGGPDANINYIEALLAWIGVRLLLRGANGA